MLQDISNGGLSLKIGWIRIGDLRVRAWGLEFEVTVRRMVSTKPFESVLYKNSMPQVDWVSSQRPQHLACRHPGPASCWT